MNRLHFKVCGLTLLFAIWLQAVSAVSPGFVYQGRYEEEGVPFDGTVTLRFSLWDSAGEGVPVAGGNRIGELQTLANVAVTDGLFTVTLNSGDEFGPDAFNGEDRWLQIEVCGDEICESLSILSPRQPITATPYALYSMSTDWSGIASIPEGFADGVDNSGDSLWGQDLINIYYNEGNVGIGTTEPRSKLEIIGQNGLAISGFQPFLTLRDTSALNEPRGVIQNGAGSLLFYPNSYLGGSPAFIMENETGNVGINRAVPLSQLDVVSSNPGRNAIYGISENGRGVTGVSTSSVGVEGTSQSGDAVSGVSSTGNGVFGKSFEGFGVVGEGKQIGVYGNNSSQGFGVRGSCQTFDPLIGLEVTGIGVHGTANGPGGTGVLAEATGGAPYALRATGDVHFQVDDFMTVVGDLVVAGSIDSTSKKRRIDHPTDPEDKYLFHAPIESSEHMNLYSGASVTDSEGYADIQLPDWFEAMNADIRYNLTVVDTADSDDFVMAKVVKEVTDNRFTIRTSKPETKVSWQVTGVRNDPSAKSRPMEVEQLKPEGERGKYLDPEAYGQPKEKGIHYSPESDLASRKIPVNDIAEITK